MEHPIFVLAYRKLEPAATWDDILMRMEPVSSKPGTGNTVSMRINRILDAFSIIYTWHGTKDWVNPTRDQRRRLALLSDDCRANNTTRGFTPGLIDLSKGEQGGRIPVPKLNGKCEGRGQEWLELHGKRKRKAGKASGPRKHRSKSASITVVDEFEDQPCPEFEIDYIAKYREQYLGGGDGDFDNQSATSDESYVETELYRATGLDNACHHHQELVDLESSNYLPVSSDQIHHTTLDHGGFIDSESSGVHSNMCDQPYPTIEMDSTARHHQEIRSFEDSEGQSYTSSDMIFRNQKYPSSSSSFLDDQHIQANHLDMPIEYHQKHARIPEHEVQPYIMRRMEFQDNVTLPTMPFSDSDIQLDPRLQAFNTQQASDLDLYDTQYQPRFPIIGNQDLAASGIRYDAQSLESNGNLQLFGTAPTAPTNGFEAQPFSPGTDFQSLENQLSAPVNGFAAQPLEPNSSFPAFNDQLETAFLEFLDPRFYETQSNLQSSNNQSASPFEESIHPHVYEPQPRFNIFDNQRFLDPTLNIAETPADLELTGQNSEDNTFPSEGQVHYQKGIQSEFEEAMFDHQNPSYY